MPDVFLDQQWHSNELMCPVCENNNLHHGAVVVYSRNEDGTQVRVTCVDGQEVATSLENSAEVENPSSRRGAISILFSCEHCHAGEDGHDQWRHHRLDVVQHKGTTYLNWSVSKK